MGVHGHRPPVVLAPAHRGPWAGAVCMPGGHGQASRADRVWPGCLALVSGRRRAWAAPTIRGGADKTCPMPQGSCRMRFEERTRQASVVGHSARTRRGKRMRAACRWAPVGLVVVRGVLLVRDVAAWGDAGHQIICEIAFQELIPQARAAVQQLLQHEADFSTFSKACTWPDHPRQPCPASASRPPAAAGPAG